MGQIFPPAWNRLPLIVAIVGSVGPALAIAGVWYLFSPWYTDVGYQPVQPVPYSHKLHVGELGLDCRLLSCLGRDLHRRQSSADQDLHELPH